MHSNIAYTPNKPP